MPDQKRTGRIEKINQFHKVVSNYIELLKLALLELPIILEQEAKKRLKYMAMLEHARRKASNEFNKLESTLNATFVKIPKAREICEDYSGHFESVGDLLYELEKASKWDARFRRTSCRLFSLEVERVAYTTLVFESLIKRNRSIKYPLPEETHS